MITLLAKIFTGVAVKLFYAFFTERLISNLVLELLRRLAEKTSNTLDDSIVEQVAANMKL